MIARSEETRITTIRKRTVDWLGLAGGEYRPIERSSLIDLGPSELASQIDWPPTE